MMSLDWIDIASTPFRVIGMQASGIEIVWLLGLCYLSRGVFKA